MKRSRILTVACQSTLLLLIAACQPAPPTTGSSPQPTGSATPTPAPTATPVSTPSPTSVPTPESTPTPMPTATPVPTPSPTPTPEATPTPSPTPTPITSGNIRVQVFSETSDILTTSQVSVKSLTDGIPYQATAERLDGFYYLKNLPLNANLEVKVTGPGYTTRTRQVTLSSTSASINLEFKGDFAISSRPEVLSVQPGNLITDPYQTLTITFSESMDHSSVENSLAFQLDSTSPSNFKVGTVIPAPTGINGTQADSVLDLHHFNSTWDGDNVLKITPRYGWPVTNETHYRMILSYRNAGNPAGGGIKDTDGNAARSAVLPVNQTKEDGPFRIGNQNKAYWPLTINTSPKPLEVIGLSATDGTSDSILVTYSGSLYFGLPNGKQVDGSANGQASSSAAGTANVSADAVAPNYRLKCNGTPVSWPAGSVATFNSVDQVRVVTPVGQSIFNSGDTCELTISGILDPSGEAIRISDLSVRVP